MISVSFYDGRAAVWQAAEASRASHGGQRREHEAPVCRALSVPFFLGQGVNHI